MENKGIKIEAIVDKNKKGYLNGITIYSLEEIRRKYNIENAVFVISAPSFVNEIKNELLRYVNKEQIYYFEVELYQYYGSDVEKYRTYILDNVEKLGKIFTDLADDYSRETMLRVIEGRLTGDLDIIADIWVQNQYWPGNIISFSENEVVVECGSSDGETLNELCQAIGHKYKHIYCFEPDMQCKDVLNKVISNLDRNNRITYFEKGTYRETTELHFTKEDLSSGLSKVDEEGKTVIQVVALDDVISEKVTYIKMDIEGAEMDTLVGAKRIISEYKPKLAVCIYHKDVDMIDIMKYLQTLNPQYKFYMRHHNCNMTETVLYAI